MEDDSTEEVVVQAAVLAEEEEEPQEARQRSQRLRRHHRITNSTLDLPSKREANEILHEDHSAGVHQDEPTRVPSSMVMIPHLKQG